MANENPEFEDDAAPDPFETELVAYLDGELDTTAARKVEARLANDPEARARAAELKTSFDMLDYLPKPEPSPNFTTRTLDMIPAVKSPSEPSGPAPLATSSTAAVRSTGAKFGPTAAVSTSMPVAILEGEEPGPTRRDARPILRMAGLVAVVAVFALAGYFATAAARLYLFPTREKDGDETRTGEPDTRVIENLPLYAVADDLAFVQELAKPELFGDEPAVVYDVGLKIPHGDTGENPTGKQFEALAKSFRTLHPARQAEIVKLDQELHAKEPKERDRLFRSLEVYAVWLERLADRDPERRAAVLDAGTSNKRLRVILEVREQQWTDALPPPQRKMLDAIAIPTERAALRQQLKDEEASRRERRAFVRQHAEAFAANKSPWPFDTETGRKEVEVFAQAVFRVDDPNPKRCRLTIEQLGEYRRTHELAKRDGVWAWYGLTVYELANLHPYLPEPSDPKLMFDGNELPPALKKGASFRLQRYVGKWPEYAIELQKELLGGKSPFMPTLGPVRTIDFKEPVRTFVTKELLPKMTGDEKRDLQRHEGKWPDYPRKLLDYAVKYDLSVPGVTLPGSPKKWDATYGIRPGPRLGN